MNEVVELSPWARRKKDAWYRKAEGPTIPTCGRCRYFTEVHFRSGDIGTFCEMIGVRQDEPDAFVKGEFTCRHFKND